MIRDWIASILQSIAQSLFNLAMAIPMIVVWLILLGVFGLLTVWVITLPQQFPESDRKDFFLT